MVFVNTNISKTINYWLTYNNYSSIFILVDENTKKYCLPFIHLNTKFYLIEIESGEKNKSLKTCSYIWKELLNNFADRKSLFINIGGGVICDMGAFCASTYKRGIDFINIPTSLLAQVDASVGAKTGIDFQGQKNMIGLFSEAKEIFIATEFLKTLPKRELLSGFAEVLKHGLIQDEKYFNYCINSFNDKSIDWDKIVTKSIKIKTAIVKADPKEKDLRKVLNFGHTFGHTLESYSLKNHKTPLFHGEAIALGMIASLYLSSKKKLINKEIINTIIENISSIYKFNSLDNFEIETLLQFAMNDKKNTLNKISIILLENVTKPNYNYEISQEEFIDGINFLTNKFS